MIEYPSVVFDCNLFLQGFGKGGNHAYRCLMLVEEGALTLYMSEACLAEIGEVLHRPRVQALFPSLDDDGAKAIVAWIREYAIFIDPVPHVFDYPVDPKDEPYIDLAIAVGAVHLVSWDKHLKRLAHHDNPDGARLRRDHPEVRVRDPKAFLDDC